jgi:hypothetical protein
MAVSRANTRYGRWVMGRRVVNLALDLHRTQFAPRPVIGAHFVPSSKLPSWVTYPKARLAPQFASASRSFWFSRISYSQPAHFHPTFCLPPVFRFASAYSRAQGHYPRCPIWWRAITPALSDTARLPLAHRTRCEHTTRVRSPSEQSKPLVDCLDPLPIGLGYPIDTILERRIGVGW